MRSIPLDKLATCDCRIQLLEALRREVRTWRIDNVPDTEEWMEECAVWIAELPSEELAQDWMMLLTFEINTYLGLSIHTASAFVQRHVGQAMINKGARA